MPIEFAPPIEQGIQPFNVQPAQYTDPLQTLAEMGQMKQQAMQTQQMQMDLQSQQGFMRAYIDANGDIDQALKLAPSYGVLPKDIFAAQQMSLKAAQDRATLDKTKMEEHDMWRDQVHAAYQPMFDEKDPNKQAALAASIGQKLVGQGLISPDKIFQYTDPQSARLYEAGLNTDKWLTTQSSQLQAKTAAKRLELEEPGIAAKTAGEQRQQAVADMQTAPVDETGVPTPAAWAELQRKYPNAGLPNTPTKNWISQFVRSSVPAEKQPEFDLNTMKSMLGMMGNTEFDQYLMQAARGMNKTPATLTPPEFQKVFQQYSEDKQDPIMRALAISLKGLQQQQTQATLSSMPTEQGIQDAAKELVEGDFSPDQIKDLRSGRTSGGPRIIEAARAYAKANNQPFSLANLEIQANTRQDTETKFATGPEAQMVRSFDNLMQHTALLDQARKALPSNNLPAMKAIANAIGSASGDTAQSTYDLIADYVAKESAKAFVPGGGGESERAQTYAHFDRNLGDAQIKNNIKGLMGVADAQREGLERQYQEGTFGKGPRIGKLFSPQALQARDQLMGKTTPAGAGGQITIRIGNKLYKYNGSGDKKDLNNWTEIRTQ